MRPASATRELLDREPAAWTDEVLLNLGLTPASPQEIQAMVWENDTFLFRHDVEQLAMRLHRGLRAAPSNRLARPWARIRDVLTRLNQDLIGPYALGEHL